MKSKVASDGGRCEGNNIPIRENGEWRMERRSLSPFSILQ
jgi:hypothetical protein